MRLRHSWSTELSGYFCSAGAVIALHNIQRITPGTITLCVVTVTDALLSFALVAGLLTIVPGLDTALVLRSP